MIKIIFLTAVVIFLNNCSFDNKTGIWTGSDELVKKKEITNQNLEIIFKKQNNSIKENSFQVVKF